MAKKIESKRTRKNWANVLKSCGINRPALATHLEQMVYRIGSSIGNGYDPAFWVMHETSNGSFYIRPKDNEDVEVTNMAGVTKTLNTNEYGVLLTLIYLSSMNISLCQEGGSLELATVIGEVYGKLQEYMWSLDSKNLVQLAD